VRHYPNFIGLRNLTSSSAKVNALIKIYAEPGLSLRKYAMRKAT